MKYRLLLTMTFLLAGTTLNAQSPVLTIYDKNEKKPIEGVHAITLLNQGSKQTLKLIAISDKNGKIELNTDYTSNSIDSVLLTHVSYKTLTLTGQRISESPTLFMEEEISHLETLVFTAGASIKQPDLIEIPTTKIELEGNKVIVPKFFTMPNEVTLRQFKEFIDDTGYVTEAELGHKKVKVLKIKRATSAYLKRLKRMPYENFEQANRKKFHGWERTFELVEVDSVNWRHDEFGTLRTESQMDYPVIHVTFKDALTYAEWAGLQLPTKAQWLAMTQDEKKSGWQRHNSTGIIRDVYSSRPNQQGIYNLYGNTSEILFDQFKINETLKTTISSYNTFSSEVSLNSFLIIDDSKILEDLFKFGFRCVANTK